MIEAASISANLGNREVLSNVNFAIEPGQHLAIVGPNGAGKTTLLRVLAGVQCPDSGQITFGARELADMAPAERARCLSYLPQMRELAWDITVGDVAALGQFAYGASRLADLSGEARDSVMAALEKTGMSDFKTRPMRTLSGGERARAHLSRALAAGSEALLLDEPCASLDIRHQLELMQILEIERESGRTIVTVLHDLELAERFATRLLVLRAGEVVADVPTETPLSHDVLTDVFALKRRPGGGFICG